MSPSRLVGSCPTFSPLPRLNGAVILFCVNPAVADTLHINKRDALCCPDFPHTPCGASDRPSNCFLWCKISVKFRFSEDNANLLALLSVRILVQPSEKPNFIWAFPRRNPFPIARQRYYIPFLHLHLRASSGFFFLQVADGV